MGKSMIPPKIEDMIVLCKQGYQDAFRSAAIITYFLDIIIIIIIRSTHGRGADLFFFCVSAKVQYWYRKICSIVRRNPTEYALALFA